MCALLSRPKYISSFQKDHKYFKDDFASRFSVDPHAHYSRLRSLSPHDWSKGTQFFSGHGLHILEVQEPLQWLRTKKRRFLDLLCYPRYQTELLWWYLSRSLQPDFWHRFLLGLEPKNERKSQKKLTWVKWRFFPIFGAKIQVFKNIPKCRIWIFSILAFSTNFCPIKTDLSGNTVWPQASGFQKLAKMDHFWHF